MSTRARSLVIVADATLQTGLGHFIRCLALADEAEERGWSIAVALGEDIVPWAHQTVLARGWKLIAVPWEPSALVKAAQALAPEGSVFLIDSYRFGGGWVGQLRRLAGVYELGATVLMDDMGDRVLDADIVVNQNVGSDHLALRLGAGTRYLSGPNFALLRREFRSLRSEALAQSAKIPDAPDRVLVLMGGSDVTGSSRTAANACLEAFPQADVEVVIPSHDGSRRLGRLLELPPSPDIALRMMAADLVVTAAGSTVWELCCLARPIAAICVADNQRNIYATLQRSGVIAGLGATPIDQTLCSAALRQVVGDPKSLRRLSRAASTLVDGKGAERVLDCFGADS